MFTSYASTQDFLMYQKEFGVSDRKYCLLIIWWKLGVIIAQSVLSNIYLDTAACISVITVMEF